MPESARSLALLITSLSISLLAPAARTAPGSTVSSGRSKDLGAYRRAEESFLPSGKQPTDVLDMAIAKSTDLVYTWYRDGTVSVGSSRRLGERVSSQPFSLPPGKRPGDVLALAIGRDDHVYAWYADGT